MGKWVRTSVPAPFICVSPLTGQKHLDMKGKTTHQLSEKRCLLSLAGTQSKIRIITSVCSWFDLSTGSEPIVPFRGSCRTKCFGAEPAGNAEYLQQREPQWLWLPFCQHHCNCDCYTLWVLSYKSAGLFTPHLFYVSDSLPTHQDARIKKCSTRLKLSRLGTLTIDSFEWATFLCAVYNICVLLLLYVCWS